MLISIQIVSPLIPLSLFAPNVFKVSALSILSKIISIKLLVTQQAPRIVQWQVVIRVMIYTNVDNAKADLSYKKNKELRRNQTCVLHHHLQIVRSLMELLVLCVILPIISIKVLVSNPYLNWHHLSSYTFYYFSNNFF